MFKEARIYPSARKLLLQHYRDTYVRPSLLEFDQMAFETAVHQKTILGIPFINLQPQLTNYCCATLDLPNPNNLCRWTRSWACVRCTSKWPLLLYGGKGFVDVLPVCHLCNEDNASIHHACLICAGTEPLRLQLAQHVDMPAPSYADAFFQHLFDSRSDLRDRYYHIQFVGRVMAMCLSAQTDPQLDALSMDPIEELIMRAHQAAAHRV